MHDECRAARRPCLPCKLELWRSEGTSPFAATSSEFYHGPTQRELARETVDRAKAEGREDRLGGPTRWV